MKIFRFFQFTILWACFVLNLRAEDSPAGYIRKIRGKMLILNSKSQVIADTEGKRSRKIKENSPFYIGETLKTLADTRVKIEFVEGGPKGKNESVLGPNTTLVVSRTSTVDQASIGTELMLKDGDVRSNVKKSYSGKSGEQFLIRTPNAVAGVRGTIFSVFYNSVDKRSQFAVEKGKVVVALTEKKSSNADQSSDSNQSNKSAVVEAGMFTEAGGGKSSVEAPQPISENPMIQKKVQSLQVDEQTGAFQSEEGSFNDNRGGQGGRRDEEGDRGENAGNNEDRGNRQPADDGGSDRNEVGSGDDGRGDGGGNNPGDYSAGGDSGGDAGGRSFNANTGGESDYRNAPLMRMKDDGKSDGRVPASFDFSGDKLSFIDIPVNKEALNDASTFNGPDIDPGELFNKLEGLRNETGEQLSNETFGRTSLTIRIN